MEIFNVFNNIITDTGQKTQKNVLKCIYYFKSQPLIIRYKKKQLETSTKEWWPNREEGDVPLFRVIHSSDVF